jgi:chorismate mutase
LAKLEKKLRRQTRRGGADTSLMPAEQLYLRAAAMAASEPEKSLVLFEDLVSLYGPGSQDTRSEKSGTAQRGNRESGERTADIVQLAKRRLEKIRPEVLRRREQEVASLEERMAAAEQLSLAQPQQATEIYQAIVNLHADDVWARAIVERARTRLAELKK